ncbi:MAG: cytochrome c oxidase assembly protein [Granulosicoccus sp.]
MTHDANNQPAGSSDVSAKSASRQPVSHLRVAGKMLAIAFAMFGFGYLMVPMYNIICDITGLNGKTGRVEASSIAAVAQPAQDRQVTVEFTASINQGGSWVFRPDVKTMTVVPGKMYNTSYYAENLSNDAVVAQATPSVTPFSAARYFNKTECFCFTRQPFEPKSSKVMPLTFVIDADLPSNVDRVTLSYTFFRSPDQT